MHSTRSLVIYIFAMLLMGLAMFMLLAPVLADLYSLAHSWFNFASGSDQEPIWRIPVAVILSGLGAYYIFWFFVEKLAIKELKRDPNYYPNLFGERTLTVSKQGYRLQSASGNNFVTWGKVQKIVDNKSCIYLFRDGADGDIVPKRAFADQEETRKFLEQTISYWKGTNSNHVKGGNSARLSPTK